MTEISGVDWLMFSIAVRVRKVSLQLDDEGVARAAKCSIGSVRRARCGLNVSDQAFKLLCAWLEQDPSEFTLAGDLAPPCDVAAPAEAPALPPTHAAPASSLGGPGATRRQASQGSAGAARSDDAPASLPTCGSFDQ